MLPIPTSAAELYDPVANSWTNAPNMSTVRMQHTATVLADGKVLVAGGRTQNNSLASAELYDPVTNTWSPAGSMTTTRTSHSATLLSNGQVLVVGGVDLATGGIATAELYDPATNTWSAAASLPNTLLSRHRHSAAERNGARGGGVISNNITAAATIYDPASNTWSASSSMARGRSAHSATLLPNGKVLVAAGLSQGTDSRVIISDIVDL